MPRGHRPIVDLKTHDEAYITVRQLADYLGVSDKTVRRKWIKSELLSAVVIHGIWRIRLRDAIAFGERHHIDRAEPK